MKKLKAKDQLDSTKNIEKENLNDFNERLLHYQELNSENINFEVSSYKPGFTTALSSPINVYKTGKKVGSESEVKEKKKSKPLKVIFNIIFWTIFGFIIFFQIVTLIDKSNGYNMSFFGYRSSVISSSSMSEVHESNKDRLEGLTDQYQKGDIVITEDVKSFDDFEVNDVVTYYDGKSLICHRVTDKVVKPDGTYYFITQGDKNNTNDGLISFDRMRGKVVNSIPKVGWASLYLQSPYGLLAISSVVLIVVITLFILEYQDNKNEEKKDVKKIKSINS